MKLSVVLALAVTTSSAARAETSLEEYGAAARPAQDIREAQCDLDVQMKGAVVTVEQRQRFTNASSRSALAYNFDLPPGAVITAS